MKIHSVVMCPEVFRVNEANMQQTQEGLCALLGNKYINFFDSADGLLLARYTVVFNESDQKNNNEIKMCLEIIERLFAQKKRGHRVENLFAHNSLMEYSTVVLGLIEHLWKLGIKAKLVIQSFNGYATVAWLMARKRRVHLVEDIGAWLYGSKENTAVRIDGDVKGDVQIGH